MKQPLYLLTLSERGLARSVGGLDDVKWAVESADRFYRPVLAGGDDPVQIKKYIAVGTGKAYDVAPARGESDPAIAARALAEAAATADRAAAGWTLSLPLPVAYVALSWRREADVAPGLRVYPHVIALAGRASPARVVSALVAVGPALPAVALVVPTKVAVKSTADLPAAVASARAAAERGIAVVQSWAAEDAGAAANLAFSLAYDRYRNGRRDAGRKYQVAYVERLVKAAERARDGLELRETKLGVVLAVAVAADTRRGVSDVGVAESAVFGLRAAEKADAWRAVSAA